MIQTKRIFFVGLGLLQDVVVRMLGEQPHVEIIGSAQTWEAAKSQIAASTPNVVIMAQQGQELSEADLQEISHPIKIIYLTPNENRIIVHDRQQISNAALADLITTLDLGEDKA
jgi:DNA-binding NarL/FixJ family response regulator